MDDQTEVPQCETTTADGKIHCELDAGHDGDHRDPGRHHPADGEVSWPPREWKTPTWATVTDLVAQVAGLTSTVRTLTEQTRILRQKLDAQEQRIHGLGRRAGELEKDREERMGHAGPAVSRADLSARLDALDGAAATEALRQHISEQASLTRRHVSVLLGTHVTRIEELIRERDIVPEDPASSPCTATAQSPTGLVTCTQDEGHTGSHTNALAVWSDAPPVPPGGVYQVY